MVEHLNLTCVSTQIYCVVAKSNMCDNIICGKTTCASIFCVKTICASIQIYCLLLINLLPNPSQLYCPTNTTYELKKRKNIIIQQSAACT
uniref:Uncharacterized protein n=1 Tax=Arundo donax TaxID=35708 RepID=A0A0A9E9L3_ARUDO